MLSHIHWEESGWEESGLEDRAPLSTSGAVERDCQSLPALGGGGALLGTLPDAAPEPKSDGELIAPSGPHHLK